LLHVVSLKDHLRPLQIDQFTHITFLLCYIATSWKNRSVFPANKRKLCCLKW